MSVKQHPRQRSDRARVDYLTAELQRWEDNLRSQYDETRPDARPFTFDEARRWSLDSQLDLIAEIRDMTAREG